jgi:spore coat polysaccharide biosynthesis protein SpsF
MLRATKQLEHWTGEFGREYIDRNAASEEMLRIRTKAWARMLAPLRGDEPKSVLECGSNIGLNLRVLPRLLDAELFAMEPNLAAHDVLIRDQVLPLANLKHAALGGDLPFQTNAIDLVFTSGVLIHVPPADLPKAVSEMYRISRKYILAIEYFSKKPESIPYRGNDELLWKRDFGSLWLEHFPDLVPIDEGFLWSRTSGYDDATWWLFRKG